MRSPDQPDPVTDDHALAAELAGLHRGDRPVAVDQRSCSGRGRPRPRSPRRRPRGGGGPWCGVGMPRPGRTRTSSSSRSRVRRRGSGRPGPVKHGSPQVDELGHGLGGGRHVLDVDPGHGQPEQGAGGGHPVVGVRREPAPVQWARADHQAVVGLGDVAAQRVELVGERGEPVGLVPAQVRDAPQRRRRVGQRGQSRPAIGVSSPASCRSTSMPVTSPEPRTVSPSCCRLTSAPIASRRSRSASPAWVVALRPVGHRDPPTGDQRGGEERRGVGQVGLDLDVEGADRSRLHRPGVSAWRRRPARRCRAASARSSSMCGGLGTGAPTWWTVTPAS